MKKTIILGIILFSQASYSQADPTSTNPNGISNTATPNIANFMRFQESSVNYYNGKNNFSIPIYEINIGGIKYPISLNYSQGGIQVNNMTSDLGLGWSLSSCAISRTIVGDPDLETVIDLRPYNIKSKYGYFRRANAGVDDPNTDLYPDIFKFVSPMNNSSTFYFADQGVVELEQKGTEIGTDIGEMDNHYLESTPGNWVNSDISVSDYKEFLLLTKEGIFYNFRYGDRDISHSFMGNDAYSNRFGIIDGTYPRVSSWNITNIEDINNHEMISFTYETYSPETTNVISDILEHHPYYKYESIYPTASVNSPTDRIIFPNRQWSNDGGKYYNRMLEVKRIKKISFRGGSVEFNYGLNREDLTNGKALTGIVVKDTHDNVIKEFELEYDYFISDPTAVNPNEFNKRLKLLSVKEKGQNNYQFEYYEDTKIPPIGSIFWL